MGLVDKAKEFKHTHKGKVRTADDVEFAVAYITSQITFSQASHALDMSGSTIYAWICSTLRFGCKNDMLTITLNPNPDPDGDDHPLE